jgi:hypothetical protein
MNNKVRNIVMSLAVLFAAAAGQVRADHVSAEMNANIVTSDADVVAANRFLEGPRKPNAAVAAVRG